MGAIHYWDILTEKFHFFSLADVANWYGIPPSAIIISIRHGAPVTFWAVSWISTGAKWSFPSMAPRCGPTRRFSNESARDSSPPLRSWPISSASLTSATNPSGIRRATTTSKASTLTAVSPPNRELSCRVPSEWTHGNWPLPWTVALYVVMRRPAFNSNLVTIRYVQMNFLTFRIQLIDRLIDWLNFHLSFDWLIDWLIEFPFVFRLIDWLIDWISICLSIDWLIDWLVFTKDFSSCCRDSVERVRICWRFVQCVGGTSTAVFLWSLSPSRDKTTSFFLLCFLSLFYAEKWLLLCFHKLQTGKIVVHVTLITS